MFCWRPSVCEPVASNSMYECSFLLVAMLSKQTISASLCKCFFSLISKYHRVAKVLKLSWNSKKPHQCQESNVLTLSYVMSCYPQWFPTVCCFSQFGLELYSVMRVRWKIHPVTEHTWTAVTSRHRLAHYSSQSSIKASFRSSLTKKLSKSKVIITSRASYD